MRLSAENLEEKLFFFSIFNFFYFYTSGDVLSEWWHLAFESLLQQVYQTSSVKVIGPWWHHRWHTTQPVDALCLEDYIASSVQHQFLSNSLKLNGNPFMYWMSRWCKTICPFWAGGLPKITACFPVIVIASKIAIRFSFYFCEVCVSLFAMGTRTFIGLVISDLHF